MGLGSGGRVGLIGRSSRAGGAALAFMLVLVACGSDDSGKPERSNAGLLEILGQPNTATGEPVNVGFVTHGRSPSLDNSDEAPVAEATVRWVNEYRGGIAGRPIDLITCVDDADPSKAGDCANELIQDGVVAVLIGSSAVLENVWTPLHEAGVPLFMFSAPNPTVASDAASTFLFGNSRSVLLTIPVALAKEAGARKVSVVAIDVPSATSFFEGPGPELFGQQGLDMELTAIAAGTADMGPEMQRVKEENPDGVVYVLGDDAFCIAAYNGLRAARYEGTVASFEGCVTDATRTGVPAEFLEGIRISAAAPLNDRTDPSMQLYDAVLEQYGADSIDRSSAIANSMFVTVAGFDAALQGLTGPVSRASVIAAARSMAWSELPGTGGRHFRCNGTADPDQPAVCTNAALVGTLDATGRPASYAVVGDEAL